MQSTTRRILLLMLMLVLALIPLQAAIAKGSPAKVIITGPGIDGEVVITNPTLLEAFTVGRFNANHRIISRSPDFKSELALGEGYRIDRYLVEGSLWDTLTYYPDPEGGEGYIFYNGNKYPNLYNENRGAWFRAQSDGDAAMQQIIAQYTEPSAAPAQSPSANPMIVGALVAVGAMLLIGFIAAQTRRNRKTAPAT